MKEKIKEPLIDSAAHLRRIFPRLLQAEKLAVPPGEALYRLSFSLLQAKKTAPNLHHLMKSAIP